MIFKIGQLYRNPSLSKWYHFLKKSEKWSRSELENYQLLQLQKIVTTAYQHSLFYKKKFDKIGVKPSDIKTLSDIRKLPLLEKEDLVQFNKEIHTDKPFSKVHKASTSGSTGTSLVFLRDESTDSFNRASLLRGYSWYDIRYWERNGYFWGINFSKKEKYKTNFLDFLQNRFRVFNYDDVEFKNFVKKLESAKYIHGYSSMIYRAAQLINQKKLQKPQNIKMVKGTSEKIFEVYQKEVTKAFGTKMISEYGATESGIIAFECPYGNMHLNEEGVLIEKIENEIVVTNLQLESFPIIRYKLGDYIELGEKRKQCKCGMSHRILKAVTGRIGSDVHGKKRIYPSLTFYYIFKNLEKEYHLSLNYQIVQIEKGKLVFKLEQILTKEQLKLLKKEIEKYFTSDIDFNILDNQTLQTKGKKMRSFISEINTND